MKKTLFYAKVLLFGEYGMIENSKGLSIPINFFNGAFKFHPTQKNDFESNNRLMGFCEYLKNTFLSERLLDIKQFKKDIDAGLFFDSNIPQGYGVGSSGALVAAVYYRYALNKLKTHALSSVDFVWLKKVFSKMENYFHGTSSGIDPLNCYLNIGLLIQSKDSISTVDLVPDSQGELTVFLLDSGIPSETAPMIQIFFDKLKNDGFRKTLKQEFVKYNNAAIDSFISGDTLPLIQNVKALSKWALENFKPMIPLSLMDIWKHGIDSDLYYLKLCGSGGGGYMLGFTKDFNKTQQQLKGFRTEVIYTL